MKTKILADFQICIIVPLNEMPSAKNDFGKLICFSNLISWFDNIQLETLETKNDY